MFFFRQIIYLFRTRHSKLIRGGLRDNSVSAALMESDYFTSSTKPALHYLEVLAKSTNQIVFAYEIAAHQFSYLNPAVEKVWCRTTKSIQNKPASLFKMVHPEDKPHCNRFTRTCSKELLSRI
jgi:hypothetical protein